VQIKVVFERLLRQNSVLRFLQYPAATYHSERTVLPLKAEHRGRIPGIIHRSSDTGATLFVEPAEAVELNNTIARLKCDEHEEITRILLAIARVIHQNADEILRTLDMLAVLDMISAKVRFAARYQAVCPRIDRKSVV
jgi:DNA mismatch repair protein MutS2